MHHFVRILRIPLTTTMKLAQCEPEALLSLDPFPRRHKAEGKNHPIFRVQTLFESQYTLT